MCLSEEFWEGKPRRKAPRDRVAVEGDVVKYLLWGNEIANWNKKTGVLIVDDRGWQTNLTMNRLNSILWRVGFSVYSERGTLYLKRRDGDGDYIWEGSHMINLETRQVTPCTVKEFNEKLSESLKKYYEKAKRLVEKKKFLVTATLDGIVYVFVNNWYGRIERQVLGLSVLDDGFKAYKCMVSTSKVYSAFTKNNPAILMSHLVKHGYQIERAESVLSELEEFGIDLDVLPERVVSELAIAKLVEG